MARPSKERPEFDRELADLPAPVRWREWMGRVEAVIFAAAAPVPRATLAPLVGTDCNLDLLIADIRDELRARPYELVSVAGGFQYRTRRAYAEIIRASGTVKDTSIDLSRSDSLVLTAIAYFQPVTRANLGDLFGKEVGRDTIATLRQAGLIAPGPRSPQPGAPFTYVTTPKLLSLWGLQSLRDLPDMDKLEEAGLLSRTPMPDELRAALGLEAFGDADEDQDAEGNERDEEDDVGAIWSQE